MARKVDVVICGKVITLKSNEEEAHLQRIARYIDAKMAELAAANASASIDERLKTMLLALNISDDYFKAADKLARVEAKQENYVSELARIQQENMVLREKFHDLQREHARLQAEHEEYIEVFDSATAKQSENVLQLHRGEQRKAGLA